MGDEWTDQIEVIPLDGSVIQTMDWALLLGGTVLTFLCTAAFIYWLYKLLLFLWSAQNGRVSIGDKTFWRNMLIALILIMLLMSGGWLLILDDFFAALYQVMKGR